MVIDQISYLISPLLGLHANEIHIKFSTMQLLELFVFPPSILQKDHCSLCKWQHVPGVMTSPLLCRCMVLLQLVVPPLGFLTWHMQPGYQSQGSVSSATSIYNIITLREQRFPDDRRTAAVKVLSK